MKKAADEVLVHCQILSSGQMRQLESVAIAGGQVTGAALMERAGRAVAGQIRLRWPVAGRACVICGPGNNGGDGYVVARLLHDAGWRVRVLGADPAPGRVLPADAAQMRALWQAIGPVAPLTLAELLAEPADIHVDAIFGTGLRRPPQGDILDILRHLGGEAARTDHVIAVDCPSGLDLDSGAMLGWPRHDCRGAPRAGLTVTFDSPRLGHVLEVGPQLCGSLVVADIGLGPWHAQAFDLPPARVAGPGFCRRAGGQNDLLARDLLNKGPRAHKFDHGHVLVIAGGPGQGGAARLAARAALRVGAGLVTLAPPSSAMHEHLGAPDALMRRPIDGPDDLSALLEDPRITSVLIGPGCGIERALALLPEVMRAGRKAVLDADALTALSRRGDMAGLNDNHVLTPHPGEFARLFPDLAASLAAIGDGALSRVDAVQMAARRAGAVVLLKGADTVIGRGEDPVHIQASCYDAAASWLGTAGSGDVLAGVIAGLLARGFAAGHAARIGPGLHAASGRLLGPGLIADDLPEAVPAILADLLG